MIVDKLNFELKRLSIFFSFPNYINMLTVYSQLPISTKADMRTIQVMTNIFPTQFENPWLEQENRKDVNSLYKLLSNNVEWKTPP